MKTAKASWRKQAVVRVVTESQEDYRWWRYQDTEPKEGYVLDTITYSVPAYPRSMKPSARQAPRTSLSRGKLRKRLYGAGLRDTKLKEVFSEIVGFEARNVRLASEGDTSAILAMQGHRYPFGWTKEAMRERLGNRVRKTLTKGIRPTFVVLDEFGYYASQGMAGLMAKASSRAMQVGLPETALAAHNRRKAR